jgi:ATP synthase protein I
MSEDPALETLKRKIKEAQKTTPPDKETKPETTAGKYFNVGVELVSGVLVGVGVGLFIDWLFGTSPWGLISLFILGSSAGMLNVYRALARAENKDDKDD